MTYVPDDIDFMRVEGQGLVPNYLVVQEDDAQKKAAPEGGFFMLAQAVLLALGRSITGQQGTSINRQGACSCSSGSR